MSNDSGTPTSPVSETPPTTPTSLVGQTTPTTPGTETPPTNPPVTPELNPDGTPKTPEAPKVETPTEFVPISATDIKMPEGLTADEPTMKSFIDIINDQALKPAERAQKLIDLQASVNAKASEAGSAEFDALQTTWQTQVKDDPEIGGANFETTMSNIGKVVDQYGTPELRQVMDMTGAGNHPEVCRFLNKIAKDLTEPTTPANGVPGATAASAASKIYPTMKG